MRLARAQSGSCLCLFDVDRTLTGQQALLAPSCHSSDAISGLSSTGPLNQLQSGVHDSAYGGGNLTLSQAF